VRRQGEFGNTSWVMRITGQLAALTSLADESPEAERAQEEKRGLIRWLRPEFQNPTGVSAGQGTLGIADKPTAGKAKKADKLPWPKTLAEQAQAVRSALAARPKPATAGELCKQFKSAKAERVAELLATLAALGQARPVGADRYVA
jgi:hypothetical protein